MSILLFTGYLMSNLHREPESKSRECTSRHKLQLTTLQEYQLTVTTRYPTIGVKENLKQKVGTRYHSPDSDVSASPDIGQGHKKATQTAPAPSQRYRQT